MARRKVRAKFLMISAVAERFEIHPQTLRLYEREGLITPVRSSGNTRLYDTETLQRLETILTLTRDMGVNLAGVEVILNMKEQLEQLQSQLDDVRESIRRDHAERRAGIRREHALVRVSGGPLIRRR